MKNENIINTFDIESPRKEYLFEMPSPLLNILEPKLDDKRDVIMLHLLWNISVTTLPFALFLYFGPVQSHLLGFTYLLLNYVVYMRRFTLTLHYSSHRRLYKKEWSFSGILNAYPSYVLCPIYGLPSGQYYLHHVIMHHVENNVFPYDISSTMTYQRDSPFHFFCYWMRFVFGLWVQLPYYAFIRKRYSLVYRCFYLFLDIFDWRILFISSQSIWNVVGIYYAVLR